MRINGFRRDRVAQARGLAAFLLGKAMSQRGISLVEVLVALAIAGGALVMFLSSLGAGSKAGVVVWERTVAEGLAQSQIEYVKGQSYIVTPGAYDTVSPLPDGYAVLTETALLAGRDASIQKITVTVYRDGGLLLTRQALKVNR